MKLQELHSKNAQPLEIHYSSNWLGPLLQESRHARRIPAKSIAPNFKLEAFALRLPAHRNLRTVIAVSPTQHEAAERLVSKRYAWRGYLPQSEGVDQDLKDPSPESSRVTLLVENCERLLGTLTVRLDSASGLLAEETYRTEIEFTRQQGRRIAEITKLAVEEGVDWKSALDALVQSAYLVTRVLHSLNDIFIEVNPRHVRFYQRILGFVTIASEGMCNRVGAPSVLMLLDLEKFGHRVRRYAC